MKLFCYLQSCLNKTRAIDFLGPLALRLYLFPIFWMAGTNKLSNINDVITWFDQGLGLPFPTLMAYLATYAEVLGAIALLLGLALRWFTIPLMITMIVAAVKVHWGNGWATIAGQGTEAAQHLQNFMAWLQQTDPGRYEYLTEFGRPVILNNGIESAATYFIMLLVLFFIGSGKYLSVDYWVNKKYCDQC